MKEKLKILNARISDNLPPARIRNDTRLVNIECKIGASHKQTWSISIIRRVPTILMLCQPRNKALVVAARRGNVALTHEVTVLINRYGKWLLDI
jgi:hypothetical protein